MTNKQVAQKLREVAIAYEILGENQFRINAYTQAAESIENLTEDIQLIWKRGDVQKISGVGNTLAQHLTELFTKGTVEHFDDITRKMPKGMYDLLKIRSIGPKTAYKLGLMLNQKEYDLGQTIYKRLGVALANKEIQKIEGFGQLREAVIKKSLTQFNAGIKKKKRMLLSDADHIVSKLRKYLESDVNIGSIAFLGSYRRRKDTIGDIDIAVTSQAVEVTISHFTAYPDVKNIVDQGVKGATILLQDGVQVDLRVIDHERFGSMLQYFTGSKYHNIRVREYALSKGFSVSEWGIKAIQSGKTKKFSDEKEFYRYLDLAYIPPELREDQGEVEAASSKSLPLLISRKDIKGDLHIHTNYNYPSSHDYGSNTFEEIVAKAIELQYEYIGFSDHNPKSTNMTEQQIIDIIINRRSSIEHIKKCKDSMLKKVYNMFEVDIKTNGTLAFPFNALDFVDGIIVSIHSSFEQSLEVTTKRILKALEYPKVRIFGHPSGRLINNREPVQADWDKVFSFCLKRDIALEVNSSPQRLDLSDNLVKRAIKSGCKIIINTDAHANEHMNNMKYGIATARRGWTLKSDIINSLPFSDFDKWFMRR